MTSTVSFSSSGTGSTLGTAQTSSSGIFTSTAGGTSSVTSAVTTGSSFTSTTGTSTTTKTCQEMQAVDETVSQQITVTPTDIPQSDKPEFQVTSTTGVSFPANETQPTINVQFGTPAEVHSITVPLNNTPGANVQQFQVTLYSPRGTKINNTPIPSSSSPQGDNTQPATLNSTQLPSTTRVSRAEITIISTTNGQSPQGVVLDIQACTQITPGKDVAL